MVNSNQIVYGGTAMIFIDAEPAAFSTNASLTVNLGTREHSSKDSGDWSDFAGTRFDWEMSTDTLLNLTGVTGTTSSTLEIYTKFIAKSAVTVIFGTATGSSPSWTASTTALSFTGEAIITSMSFNAPNLEDGSATISLKGTGALTGA